MRKLKFLAPIAHILANPQTDWQKLTKSNIRVAFRKIDVDWQKYNTKDYLFTHDTIVCSVETESNGYWITKPCEELVNANGNAWTNEVLLNCFRTFIGGQNYQEHVQIPALSKGKILDAVIRPVVHTNKYGSANIYMVDILVATNRKHTELVRRIESGELNTLSMGAIANETVCSICGKHFKDNDVDCEHLAQHLGGYYKCSDGKMRKVAELCGALDEKGEYIPDSCKFIEASWVQNPAFGGAVLNNFVETEQIKAARMDDKALTNVFDENIFQYLRVADTESNIALKIAKEYIKISKIAKKVAKDYEK